MNKDGTNNISSFKRGNNWIGSPSSFTRLNAPLPPPSLSNIFRSLFIPVIRDLFHAQPVRNPYGANSYSRSQFLAFPPKKKKNHQNNFRSFFSTETLMAVKILFMFILCKQITVIFIFMDKLTKMSLRLI